MTLSLLHATTAVVAAVVTSAVDAVVTDIVVTSAVDTAITFVVNATVVTTYCCRCCYF